MNDLTVRDIMSTELVTLEESESLNLAEQAMMHGRIRHLPVVRGSELVGLVTHRDLLRAQVSSLAEVSIEERKALKSAIRTKEIMATDVKSVSVDLPVLEAARILKKNKFGCLPVVEGNTLVGIVTEADFIDLVIRALEDEEQKVG